MPAGPKVRPIQTGEFVRKWVTRQLPGLQKGDIGKVMAAKRQLGNGMSGGAEALAIFHQLLFDIWKSSDLRKPLARVKVKERNWFGMLEWPAIREAARETLPKHYPVACWKHAAGSEIEQRDVDPATKDRGAKQGDVDGPLECSLVLGAVVRSARQSLHKTQRQEELPRATTEDEEVRIAAEEFDQKVVRAETWAAASPAQRRESRGSNAIVPDPRHEIQSAGALPEFWYLGDGDILCGPLLVYRFLRSFDVANDIVGGVQNRIKIEVTYFADDAIIEAHAEEWQLEQVRGLAAICSAVAGGLTLGVHTGSFEQVEAQMHQKVNVVKAMQARIALCSDAQTKHVLNRQSLGKGRVNLILRVHGDQMLRAGGERCWSSIKSLEKRWADYFLALMRKATFRPVSQPLWVGLVGGGQTSQPGCISYGWSQGAGHGGCGRTRWPDSGRAGRNAIGGEDAAGGCWIPEHS